MKPTFRCNAKKFSLGTQVLPCDMTYYINQPKKYEQPKCGFLPFDIQLQTYTRIGKNGDPQGFYMMYFPPKSVVRLTPKRGGLNQHYFEQIVLTGRNTFANAVNNWVELPQDTTQDRVLYLWIARINGANRSCVGFANAKPQHVLHEIALANVPAMAVWGNNGVPQGAPRMADQYYHGVYRFIDFCDSRSFAFEPVQAARSLRAAAPQGVNARNAGEHPIVEEECKQVPVNPYINVSGKTIRIDGWTTDNEQWDGTLCVRILGNGEARFENGDDWSAGQAKYPGTEVFEYVQDDEYGLETELRKGVINLPVAWV